MESGKHFQPQVRPRLRWQEGLYEALVEAFGPVPEPIRSFAFRRAVEEVEFRVMSEGGKEVSREALLTTLKVSVSHSMFNALRRVLIKKEMLHDSEREENP